MKKKYQSLPESEASEAYIIEEYLAFATTQPDRVKELTRLLQERDVHGCIVIMALVSALLRNTNGQQ